MRKYNKTLIYLLALVALINLCAAIGGYVISKNISQNNGWILGIGQTKIALESLTDNMIEISQVAEHLDWRKNQSEELIEESSEQRKEINQNLAKILEKIDASEKKKIFYSSKESSKAAHFTQDSLKNLWQPLEIELLKLFQQFNDKDPALMDSLFEATNGIKKQNQILRMGLNDLEKIHKGEAERFSSYLVIVQSLEVVCTVLVFLYLISLSLTQIKYSDKKLLVAQRENLNIMNTINEGLFLINKNLVIASQYSSHLEEILGRKKLAGQKLDNVLSDIISKQDLQMTRDFVAQVYNDEVYEDLIQELNPLDKIEIKDRESGNPRYLNFRFSRVYGADDEIVNVLVSLTDITKQVVLEEKLEKERVQHDEQIEMLSTILNVSDDILESFLRHLDKSTTIINDILQIQEGMSLLTKANKIFTEVHSIKGEASSLSLSHIVNIIEEMEENLSKLKEKQEIKGIDFLPITIKLNRLVDLSHKIKKIRHKITQGKISQPIDENQLKSQLEKFVNDIALRQNKKIEFILDNNCNDLSALDEIVRDNIHSSVIQLLRNAIVHGIENEEIRKIKNKPVQGKVFCKINLKDNNLIVQVGDDGAGINFDALRQKAKKAGLLDIDGDDANTREKLIKFMFLSGVSTAKMQTEDAGRGMGMEVVKKNLDEIGAKINIETTKDKGTTFTIDMKIKE